jgi:hypothetical protein
LAAESAKRRMARKGFMLKLRCLAVGFAVGAFGFGMAAQAATYYIDFSSGDDKNAGTSKTSPWRVHPYMLGFVGSYSKAPGDRFIFKGGVTWPRSVFQMRIAAGGASDASRHYYGADTSWYNGAAWQRPIFDFEHTLIPGGWHWSAGVVVDNVSFITFDNLEMIRHRAPLNNLPNVGDWGACTLLLKGNVNNLTVQNCVIRDWSIPTPIVPPAHDGGGGGGIIKVESSGGANVVISRCVFHQAGSPVRSGKALHLGGEIAHCEIYETSNAILGGGSIHDNHVYNIRGATDPTAHENAIYTFAPSVIYNNRVHDLDVNSSAIYVSPSFSGGTGYDLIYNNLVYAVGNQAPIQIDLEGASPSLTGARVYNNTLEHGNGYCVRVGIRGTAVLGLLDCRNNHLITSGTPIGYNNPPGGCANVNSVTIAANLVHTQSQASANGYVPANGYAPVAASSPTVNTALDLSTTFGSDLLGTPRPAGAWDIGAYEFSGGGTRVNLSPVIAPVQANVSDASSTAGGFQVTEGSTVTLTASISDPIEAESGSIQAPFVVENGTVYQPSQTTMANGGRATYAFTISEPGDYMIAAQVSAPTEASNSFYVSIDSDPVDPHCVWHVPVTGGFERRVVSWQGNGTWDKPAHTPKYFTLSAGPHTLVIIGREAGVKLDRITLVKSPAPPTNLRMASGH